MYFCYFFFIQKQKLRNNSLHCFSELTISKEISFASFDRWKPLIETFKVASEKFFEFVLVRTYF